MCYTIIYWKIILEFVHHVIVLGLPHTHASQCVL